MKAEVLGVLIAIPISAVIAWNLVPHQQEEPPCSGIYMVGNYAACESPWSKDYDGSTKYFWVEEPYTGALFYSLWVGSSHDLKRWSHGKAWPTKELAEKALGKKFRSEKDSGDYMPEIK